MKNTFFLVLSHKEILIIRQFCVQSPNIKIIKTHETRGERVGERGGTRGAFSVERGG